MWDKLVEELNQCLGGLAWNSRPSTVPAVYDPIQEIIYIHRVLPIKEEEEKKPTDIELDFEQQYRADQLFRVLKRSLSDVGIIFEKHYQEGRAPCLLIHEGKNSHLVLNQEVINKIMAPLGKENPYGEPKLPHITFHPEVKEKIGSSNEKLCYNIGGEDYRVIEKRVKVNKLREVIYYILANEQDKFFVLKVIPGKTFDYQMLIVIHFMRKLGFLLAAFNIGEDIHLLSPYLPQKDLEDFLEDGCPLTNSDMLRIILGCCEAVYSLQAKGKIHGDVKFANFVIEVTDGQMSIRLLDFEFSVNVKKSKFIIKSSSQGTEDFVSPETLRRRCCYVSDVYSLGVMLEMLLLDYMKDDDPWPEWGVLYNQMTEYDSNIRMTLPQAIEFLIKLGQDRNIWTQEELFSLKENNNPEKACERILNKNTLFYFQDYCKRKKEPENDLEQGNNLSPRALTPGVF